MSYLRSLTLPRFATLTLVCYWIVLATSTHVPDLPSVGVQYSDKSAHFLAYALLAFLLSWTWTTRRAFIPKGLLFALAVATLYGALDELTQIPVPGRCAEWYDWMADILGATTGVCLFWGLDTLRRIVWRREAQEPAEL